MNRRSVLATAASALVVGAGCVRKPESGPRTATSPAGGSDDGTSSQPDTPALSATDESYGGGFTSGGAWPTHCFDAGRRGENPATDVPDGDVGAAWLRTPIESERTYWTTPPVTDDSRVFVGSGAGEEEGRRGGFVAAFDGETGTREWRTRVTSGFVDGVSYRDGAVLAVSSNHEPQTAALTALAAADGSVTWQVDLPLGPTGGPVVARGCAYVSTRKGGLSAVSLDGSHRWTRRVAAGEEYASTAPCAAGSSVFVGTDRGRVVAVDADDGRRRWRSGVVTGGHRPRIQTIPTVADGTVYVTGTDYRLYAVDATDGTTRWETRLLDGEYGNAIPSVTVRGERLYVNTIHGGLLALRRTDGTEEWRTGKYGGSQPAAVGEDLVVAPSTGGTVRAFDASGARRWTFEMPAFDVGFAGYIMDPEVALAHDRAYVSLNDGRVFSLGAR